VDATAAGFSGVSPHFGIVGQTDARSWFWRPLAYASANQHCLSDSIITQRTTELAASLPLYTSLQTEAMRANGGGATAAAAATTA
jgi:hypothetical protein